MPRLCSSCFFRLSRYAFSSPAAVAVLAALAALSSLLLAPRARVVERPALSSSARMSHSRPVVLAISDTYKCRCHHAVVHTQTRTALTLAQPLALLGRARLDLPLVVAHGLQVEALGDLLCVYGGGGADIQSPT